MMPSWLLGDMVSDLFWSKLLNQSISDNAGLNSLKAPSSWEYIQFLPLIRTHCTPVVRNTYANDNQLHKVRSLTASVTE